MTKRAHLKFSEKIKEQDLFIGIFDSLVDKFGVGMVIEKNIFFDFPIYDEECCAVYALPLKSIDETGECESVFYKKFHVIEGKSLWLTALGIRRISNGDKYYNIILAPISDVDADEAFAVINKISETPDPARYALFELVVPIDGKVEYLISIPFVSVPNRSYYSEIKTIADITDCLKGYIHPDGEYDSSVIEKISEKIMEILNSDKVDRGSL